MRATREPDRVDRPSGPSGARLHSLPRRIYRFRILGMGLAALPIAVVLRELHAPWPVWAWMAASCFAWPHLAWQLSRRSVDPPRAELRNLMIDSAIAGSWVPLLHFNLLPSAVLLTVATADKVNSGIRGLWLRSIPALLLALLATGLVTGFAVQPQTSQAVILACLPLLVIHTLAVSMSSYRLVRRVQRQNQKLDELSRIDALTGLASRGHWLEQAQALLQRHQQQAEPATLMLADVDRFKDVNDRHGHGVGDDVLRGVADVIRASLAEDGHAGRLGGDEFVIALPASLDDATRVAERIRVAVAQAEMPRLPHRRCSISIGLAPPPAAGLGVREWLEAADRALYRAKRAGRNRVAAHESVLAASD